MARDSAERRKRKGKSTFSSMPHAVVDSPAYASLKKNGAKLLTVMFRQYNGRNNGVLVASLSKLKRYGFTSQGTITRAISELLESGLIVRTRLGEFAGTESAGLYAVTWVHYDYNPQIHDLKRDQFPLGAWKQKKSI